MNSTEQKISETIRQEALEMRSGRVFNDSWLSQKVYSNWHSLMLLETKFLLSDRKHTLHKTRSVTETRSKKKLVNNVSPISSKIATLFFATWALPWSTVCFHLHSGILRSSKSKKMVSTELLQTAAEDCESHRAYENSDQKFCEVQM